MSRALVTLSTALWASAFGWVLFGPMVPGVPTLLTGAAVTATICATIRTVGLSDRDIASLGLLAGRSTQHDNSRDLAGHPRAESWDPAHGGPLL